MADADIDKYRNVVITELDIYVKQLLDVCATCWIQRLLHSSGVGTVRRWTKEHLADCTERNVQQRRAQSMRAAQPALPLHQTYIQRTL